MATAPERLSNAAQLFHRGDFDQAAQICRQVLDRDRDDADALLLLGGICQRQGRIDDWIATLMRLRLLRPQRPEVHSNLGSALALRGNLREAERHFREAIRLGPNRAEIHKNLGNVLRHLGRDEESMASYRRAIELRPQYAEAYNCLAELLAQRGEFNESLKTLHRAIALRPDFLEAHINLGTTFALMCRNEEAFAAYNRALELNPGSAEAHLNKSFALLRSGNFAEGWKEYEWRMKCKGVPTPCFRRPLWNGEPLRHKRLLLYAEQGHGDAIQFIRYARLAKDLGATVIVRCSKYLLPLLSRCEEVDQWCTDATEPPPFDVYAPLASMPYLLWAQLASIPADVPYVFPNPDLVLRWRRRLGEVDGFKIGIAWQGNPRYHGDRLRSVPLKFFEPLSVLPDTHLISLQKGLGSEQVPQVADKFLVHELAPDFDESSGAFMDSAAVISNLDLVVTSDTAVAHLAGALGVRTWLALSRVPNWRWMQDRGDSPWYPTMRLFRQERPGDWQGVFRCMAKELQLLRKGEREQVYAAPTYYDADRLNLAGISLAQAGKLTDAIDSFRHALKINPGLAEAYNNLGIALAQVRNFNEAAEAFRHAVRLNPSSAESHNNLGSVLAEQQDFEAAIRAYEQALRLAPKYLDAYVNLGKAQRNCGRLEEAAQSFRQALAINPKLVKAHRDLGVVLATSGRADDAIAAFQKAIELDPSHAESHYHLGCVLKDANRIDEAADCFESALVLRPEHFESRNCLGICFAHRGKHDQAIEQYRQALGLRADFSAAYSNWGISLSAQGRFDEALEKYREARQINPSSPEVYNNIGSALCGLGEYDRGLQSYSQAIELKADYAEAHRNRSVVHLLLGRFEDGWPEYEWRWKCKDFKERVFNQPAWNGESLAGKTILLHAEQGLGDTMQFIRYAPLLKELGAAVIVRVPKQLVPILGGCCGIDRLITDGDEIPAFDVHLPLMSLPYRLGTTVETIPDHVPYLLANEQLVSAWGKRLAGVDGLRVGIGWQGNRKYAADNQRSIPLSEFKALGTIPDLWILSLQKGPGSEQVHDLADEFTLAEIGPELDSVAGAFMDTAAIMRHLDLVITSDTALAHLAGGLGVPVWVAIPHAPDWRWGLEGERCPWYPTMRLFRQTAPGNWRDVFQRIAASVQEMVERRRSKRVVATGSRDGAMASNQRGVALAESDQLVDALACFRNAIWLAPTLVSAHHNYGTTLHRLGRVSEAITSFKRCLRLNPANADTHSHLGVSYASLGRLDEAESSLRAALRYNPESIQAIYSLGNVLTAIGRFDEALACFRQTLQRNSAFAEGEFGIGNVLLELGRHEEALAAFDRAIHLKPGFAPAIQQRARVCLLTGDLTRGWNDYRPHRSRIEPAVGLTRWSAEPLKGKRILLIAELDDSELLLFARYLSRLKQQGALVSVRVPERCKQLLACCEGVDQVIAEGDPYPEADCWAFLADIPRLAGTTMETIPASVPYFRLPDELRRRWPDRLNEKAGFKVGICWSDQPGPVRRGMSWEWIRRLADIPGVRLIRLPTPGEPARSVPELAGMPLTELSAVPRGPLSFCDVAAAIVQLDLIIAADGAVAHLAGALGAPTWVILPFAARWYWHRNRTDCPWYPSVRLFRQSEAGGWDDAYDSLDRTLRRAILGDPAASDGPQQTESDDWNRKGIACVETGDLEGAMQCFQVAVERFPASADSYNNLGTVFSRLGRYEEAMGSYLTAIKHAPAHAQAHSNLGIVFARLGRNDDAAHHFRQALRYDPNAPKGHYHLGNACLAQGDLEGAISCYERAIRLNPDDWDAQFSLAIGLREADRLNDAITVLERLEKLRPGDPEVHNNLGIAHSRLRNYHVAIEYFEKVIANRPAHAAAYNNLGITLGALERYEEAVAAYRRALDIEPRYAEAYSNLGTVLTKIGDFTGSLQHFDIALELRPDYAEAYNNRGVALKEMGRIEEALGDYDEAIRLRSDYVDAHTNRALARLLTGEFTAGWSEYEWRWKAPGMARTFAQPVWDGGPLEGKVILLHCEQGLGDSLQFIRYAALVKRRGGKIILRCPKALTTILQSSDVLDLIIAEGEPLPPFDCHAPLMSLARIFGTTLASVPASIPYLQADRRRIEKWQAALGAPDALRIGIGWQGNPRYQGDRRRSIPLASFAPIGKLPGVKLFSLQMGTGAEQIALVKEYFRVHEFGPEFDKTCGAFMDTAAVMEQLDLVITSDSAIAHLAGALGVRVWVALPYAADWRWLSDRHDTPWYPSMRLFRQQSPGDWLAVFHDMRDQIEKERAELMRPTSDC